jgi:hypothetical protein
VDKQLARVLIPGDVLLYAPSGVFGKIIALKTWSTVSHVEVYVGNGESVASRDGKGVGKYPFRDTELAFALRPRAPFDLAKALAWFQTVDGEGYDWVGLLVFANIRQTGRRDKMWCSNFAARFMRVGLPDDCPLFGAELDADKVAPSTFLSSPNLATFWKAP